MTLLFKHMHFVHIWFMWVLLLKISLSAVLRFWLWFELLLLTSTNKEAFHFLRSRGNRKCATSLCKVLENKSNSFNFLTQLVQKTSFPSNISSYFQVLLDSPAADRSRLQCVRVCNTDMVNSGRSVGTPWRSAVQLAYPSVWLWCSLRPLLGLPPPRGSSSVTPAGPTGGAGARGSLSSAQWSAWGRDTPSAASQGGNENSCYYRYSSRRDKSWKELSHH